MCLLRSRERNGDLGEGEDARGLRGADDDRRGGVPAVAGTEGWWGEQSWRLLYSDHCGESRGAGRDGGGDGRDDGRSGARVTMEKKRGRWGAGRRYMSLSQRTAFDLRFQLRSSMEV